LGYPVSEDREGERQSDQTSPTFSPTRFPTVESCLAVTIGLFDTGRDGWSGNILSLIGTKSSTPPVTLQLPAGYGSQYHYLCLPKDTYTITCCHGTDHYEEISWNILVSSTAASTSGGASANCDETMQTFSIAPIDYSDDVSPMILSSFQILLISILSPVILACCICCFIRCRLRRAFRGNTGAGAGAGGPSANVNLSTRNLAGLLQVNQLLHQQRGGGQSTAKRDGISLNPIFFVPSSSSGVSGGGGVGIGGAGVSGPSAPPLPSTYSGTSSPAPSAPNPTPADGDVLRRAFPEFYSANQPSSSSTSYYGYS
jgi:hypothetical protein